MFFRIATEAPSFQANDLSGEGARLSGGRWNPPGLAVVYASSTASLACLESLVHLNNTLPLNRYLVAITLSDGLIKRASKFDVKKGIAWDAKPAGRTSIAWGGQWLAAARSLCALVPSVVVPEELNLLINPAHPDITQVSAKVLRRWTFDARLSA